MAAPMLTMPPSSSDGVGDMWIPLMPSPPPTPAPPEASLSTQERLRLAKRRRAAQLKRWAQREVKGGGAGSGHSASSALQPDLIQGLGAGAGGSASPELASVGVYSSSNVKKATKLKASSASAAPLNRPGRVLNSSGRGISFVANVMLLEAAARNDVEEGECTFLIQQFDRPSAFRARREITASVRGSNAVLPVLTFRNAPYALYKGLTGWQAAVGN